MNTFAKILIDKFGVKDGSILYIYLMSKEYDKYIDYISSIQK